MRGTIGLAASAAVAFIIFTILSRPALSWGGVVNKVSATRSLTLDLIVDSEEPLHIYIKGGLMRLETYGRVTIWKPSNGKALMLDLTGKRATSITFASQSFDFYQWLKGLRNGHAKILGRQHLDGQEVRLMKVTRPVAIAPDRTEPSAMTLWVDPSTQLPRQAEAEINDTKVLLKNLRFDAEINDKLFDTSVPAGFVTTDLGGVPTSQLQPRPAGQGELDSLTLKPGVGIGQLKFGAQKEEVIRSLGEPEEVHQGIDFRYPSKGLFVLVHPKAGLLRIVAMSKKAADAYSLNDFPGKTDRGIALGDKRTQIEAAYGKPATVRDRGNMVVLEYKNPDASFMLSQDKLVEIVLGKQ